jgi:hypothetical protein
MTAAFCFSLLSVLPLCWKSSALLGIFEREKKRAKQAKNAKRVAKGVFVALAFCFHLYWRGEGKSATWLVLFEFCWGLDWVWFEGDFWVFWCFVLQNSGQF